MAEIRVGKNETLDSALRRFKRSCQNANIMKNPAYGERKSPKRHVNVNLKHNPRRLIQCL